MHIERKCIVEKKITKNNNQIHRCKYQHFSLTEHLLLKNKEVMDAGYGDYSNSWEQVIPEFTQSEFIIAEGCYRFNK